MTCPETVATEAEIEADVWVEIDVKRGTVAGSGFITGGYVPGYIFNPTGPANLETTLQIYPIGYWSSGDRLNTGGISNQRWFFDAYFENGINVNSRRRRNDVYNLTFDRSGPGGVSSVVMQSQADWNFTQPFPGVIQLQKTAGTGTLDFIFMNWQREVPLITISKRSVTPALTPQPDEIVRYSPEPNSTFSQWDSTAHDGTWPVATSTVFKAVGRAIGNDTTVGTWQSKAYFNRATNIADPFAGFPTQITVTR
jgi:hypothetical protein